MKPTILLIFLLASFISVAADNQEGRDWIYSPSGKFHWSDWTELPATDIYEVVASKTIVVSIFDLADKRSKPVTEEAAKNLTGHYYRCSAGKKPYLVRAVYGQGGTGHYTISRHGNELLVYHASLGHTSAAHKSALIVNLDFTPTEVFTFLSIAE